MQPPRAVISLGFPGEIDRGPRDAIRAASRIAPGLGWADLVFLVQGIHESLREFPGLGEWQGAPVTVQGPDAPLEGLLHDWESQAGFLLIFG